jgi:hypothetical protein
MQTPVDLTQYGDLARPRMPGVASQSADALPSPRLSISRRPLLDLPLSAAALPIVPAQSASVAGARLAAAPNGEVGADPDATSTFDVPAFLRRQES